MKFPPDIAELSNWRKWWPVGLVLLLFFLPFSLDGQTRKELESRRKKLLQDIKITSTLLNKTARSRAAALDRYVALKSQIKSREALLATLQEEMSFMDTLMLRNTEVVTALKRDMTKLEEEYALMARKAQRLRMTNSRLLFIFSAESFNDVFRRWQYLRQYDNYRKRQAQLIVSTQTMLSAKVQQLEIQKEEKQLLVASEEEQKTILEKEMLAKSSILKTLRNDEDRLRNNLASKRKAHHKLNTAIENVIRQEIIAQRKRARDPESLNATAGRTTPKSSDAARPRPDNTRRSGSSALTGEFRRHRGRLNWPVGSGVITSYFGKQSHPTLQKIQITNNGIDIQTQQRAKVKAVFKGEVVGTQFIPGYHYMVILRHGNYFTVYSNLEEVYVKKGAQVATQQSLGRVAVDKRTGKSEVHFEVWRDKVRLNPTDWVRR